jgi:hypothetical protein
MGTRGRIIIHQNAQDARPQRTGAHSGYAAYSGTTELQPSNKYVIYLELELTFRD